MALKLPLTLDHIAHEINWVAPYVEEFEFLVRYKLAKRFVCRNANPMAVLLEPFS